MPYVFLCLMSSSTLCLLNTLILLVPYVFLYLVPSSALFLLPYLFFYLSSFTLCLLPYVVGWLPDLLTGPPLVKSVVSAVKTWAHLWWADPGVVVVPFAVVAVYLDVTSPASTISASASGTSVVEYLICCLLEVDLHSIFPRAFGF